MLVVFAVVFILAVRIIAKAGYSSVWVLTMLVPVVNVIMFWVFAFVKWPVED